MTIVDRTTLTTARLKRRTRLRLGAAIVCLVGLAVAGIFWLARLQGNYADRVIADVRAAVPRGSSRQQAEAWVQRTYGVIPTYHSDVTANRIQGQTIPERAGLPAADLGGLVFCTVRPRGGLAEVFNRLRDDQVWVYFLLDKEQHVRDYYFLSLAELRELEQKAARAR